MYQLFYSPGACSRAIHALLYDIGAKFEAKAVDFKNPASKTELLKANPEGQVPTLVIDGEGALPEGMAIMLYLLEKHASQLLPKQGHERTQTLYWLAYLNATLHPMNSPMFHPDNYVDGAEAQKNLLAKQHAKIAKAWERIDAHLAETKFLAGENLTMADILMTVIAGWAASFKPPIAMGTHVQRVIDAVSKHEGFAKAVEAENASKKQAA